MTKWEYLKHRARLAGLRVDDSGYSVEFAAPGPHGDNIAVFSKVAPHNGQPGVDAAAQWLMQECDMHIPGWELPWPA